MNGKKRPEKPFKSFLRPLNVNMSILYEKTENRSQKLSQAMSEHEKRKSELQEELEGLNYEYSLS